MTVLNFIEKCSNSANIRIFNAFNLTIAVYNGKDSIPCFINTLNVDNISVSDDVIMIKTDSSILPIDIDLAAAIYHASRDMDYNDYNETYDSDITALISGLKHLRDDAAGDALYKALENIYL